MSMPRCGRPDIERVDDDDDPNDFGLAGNIGGLGRRKKRYVAGNSYVRRSVHLVYLYSLLKLQWYNKKELETWANAQRDGRPAEHRWRPLSNAAKFGSRRLLHAVQ